MRYHFTLEYRRLRRQIEEFGLNPTWVLLVLGLLLSTLVLYVSVMSEKPSWLIFIAGISALSIMYRKKRTSFYSAIYPRERLLKIQFIEASILTAPFFLILLLSGFTLPAFILLILAMMSPAQIMLFQRNKSKVQLPPLLTPFKKNPFEFIRGFRSAWPLVLVFLFVIIKAKEADNFNLGLVAFLVAILSMAFIVAKPEPMAFVTIYIHDTRAFLKHKIQLIIKQTLLLSSPLALTLLVFFPDKILFVLAAILFGLLFSLASLLGKYAYFPAEMNVIQSIGLALSLMIPPLVLVLIPVFYKKALVNLKPLLS